MALRMCACVFVQQCLSRTLVQLQENKVSVLPEPATPAAACGVF